MTASPGRVASAVRRQMQTRRIPQRLTAAHLRLSQQSLSDRLCGRRAFRADEILSLADFFDVPVSVLMEEPSPPERTDAPPTRRAPAQAIPA